MSEAVATKAASGRGRILELDALRALAAINLMLFHFTHVYSVKYGYTSDLGFEFPYGKYGVELFFMLSGLVNAMTLLKKREPNDFLASRFIRIVPSFLLVISLNLLLLFAAPIYGTVHVTPDQVAANMTIMPNLFGYECLEPVTWTLQVELLFYVILLSFFISGALEKPLVPLMWYLALCVAGTIYLEQYAAAYGTVHWGVTQWFHDAMLLRYFPLFAIGIFIQQMRFTDKPVWTSWLGIAVSAVVFHMIDNHGHNPLATVLMVGLLIASAYQKVALFRLRPLVFISSISYSLYLLHNNLGSVYIYHMNHLGIPPLWCFISALVFTVLISSVATYWLERPVSNWLRGLWKAHRERLIPSRWVAAFQTGAQ